MAFADAEKGWRPITGSDGRFHDPRETKLCRKQLDRVVDIALRAWPA